MFCTNCGKELKDGMRFCTSCGKPVVSPQTFLDGGKASVKEAPADIKEEKNIPPIEEKVEEPKNDIISEEEPVTAKETPCEEAPHEEAPCEEAPCEEAPCEEAPCEEAPCEETLCEAPKAEPLPEETAEESGPEPANPYVEVLKADAQREAAHCEPEPCVPQEEPLTVVIDKKYKPFGTCRYFFTLLLLALPYIAAYVIAHLEASLSPLALTIACGAIAAVLLVDIILVLVWAFCRKINLNRKNLARAVIILFLLTAAAVLVLVALRLVTETKLFNINTKPYVDIYNSVYEYVESMI